VDPHPPEAYDPYGDSAPETVDPLGVLSGFFNSVGEFLDFVFTNPPGPMRGQWLDEQEVAWNELRSRIDVDSLGARVAEGARRRAQENAGEEPEFEAVRRHLDEHGLSGRALYMKITEWRDKSRWFFKLRNTRRLAKALRTAGVIAESAAECAGVGGAYKEAIKGLNHLTDIAIEEGA